MVRLLEIHEATGRKPSELRSKGPELFSVCMVGILPPKDYEEHVRARIEKMLENGLLAEIETAAAAYGWETPPMQSINYQEFRAHLEGKESLQKAVDAAVENTKEFSRRQMLWFKRDSSVHWIDSREEAEEFVQGFICI
jgi:tRNA dimethylallyltransferase